MHHDSDWNYVNRADQNRVPNLSRARFDYKRKDEDDMAKSTKTYEERIRALEKRNRKASKLPKSSLHSERNWKRERKPRKVKTNPQALSDWRCGGIGSWLSD